MLPTQKEKPRSVTRLRVSKGKNSRDLLGSISVPSKARSRPSGEPCEGDSKGGQITLEGSPLKAPPHTNRPFVKRKPGKVGTGHLQVCWLMAFKHPHVSHLPQEWPPDIPIPEGQGCVLVRTVPAPSIHLAPRRPSLNTDTGLEPGSPLPHRCGRTAATCVSPGGDTLHGARSHPNGNLELGSNQVTLNKRLELWHVPRE